MFADNVFHVRYAAIADASASIIRQLPHSINKRINKLSCDKETFDAASPLYNDALKQSNFDTNLAYTQTQDNSQRRNRQRNVIWYNPPYSKNVRTNVAQTFLKLIDKHFPPLNKLHKLFNRHTVRASYSCITNMKNVIRKHNKRILTQKNTKSDTTNNNTSTCNCQKSKECPLSKHSYYVEIIQKLIRLHEVSGTNAFFSKNCFLFR